MLVLYAPLINDNRVQLQELWKIVLSAPCCLPKSPDGHSYSCLSSQVTSLANQCCWLWSDRALRLSDGYSIPQSCRSLLYEIASMILLWYIPSCGSHMGLSWANLYWSMLWWWTTCRSILSNHIQMGVSQMVQSGSSKPPRALVFRMWIGLQGEPQVVQASGENLLAYHSIFITTHLSPQSLSFSKKQGSLLLSWCAHLFCGELRLWKRF